MLPITTDDVNIMFADVILVYCQLQSHDVNIMFIDVILVLVYCEL